VRPAASPSAEDAPITVEYVDQSQPPLYLNGPVVRLGRSPTADIVFPPHDTAISANHAKVVSQNGELIIFDTESKNGVYVNGHRVTRAKLSAGDVVRLGPGGPELRFTLRAEAERPSLAEALRQGLTVGMQAVTDMPSVGEAQVLGEFPLGPQPLVLGRAPDCTVHLDSVHVSARHAEVFRDPAGVVRVRDLRSTNGTFVGGARVFDTPLAPGAELIIGPFFLRFTGASLVLFDTRGRTWVEGRDLEFRIGSALILDGITVSAKPGEFVGMLGPSGAGKSMLLKAMCGSHRATGGRMLVNGLDFYQHYAQLRNLVGYVPQDDIIHTQLTVEDTLRYAAALRLPPELGHKGRDRRVLEVLSALELQNHRHLPAWRLSGGQRKRLSMGVELLTEPNLLYLDEPTSGLDPNLEEKMMVLFRELALRGKTVCCVTHLLDHIDLCDQIALLYGGRLAYFGTPSEALGYFGVRKLADAYHVLEEHDPEYWKTEYQRRSAQRQLAAPPAPPEVTGPAPRPARARSGPGPLRQLAVLSRRYAKILTEDPKHTLILLLQAPILGFLIALATRGGQPGWRPTSVLFLMLSLSAFWFGCVNAAREITKEAPVTARERMVGVGVLPYVLSKFLVLQLLAAVQVAILLLIVSWLGPPRQMAAGGGGFAVILGPLPGSYGLALLNLYLTALGGLGLGLVISSIAGNSDKAMSLVPIALLPQILFAGALAVPKQGTFTRIAGYLVGVNWSFDLFRREIACTPEELVMKKAPDCLASFDPNLANDVMGHMKAPGREIVLLIKDGVYSMPRDLGVLAGMVVLFFVIVVVLQWRKKPV
jgi:ABC-type multidrug transport system ATPase subunit/pSer/pThr/pTyr-binding forkhead associated (FHA) protein